MPHGVVRSGKMLHSSFRFSSMQAQKVAISTIMLAAESEAPPHQNTPLSALPA
jgi:hypothetical protein